MNDDLKHNPKDSCEAEFENGEFRIIGKCSEDQRRELSTLKADNPDLKRVYFQGEGLETVKEYRDLDSDEEERLYEIIRDAGREYFSLQKQVKDEWEVNFSCDTELYLADGRIMNAFGIINAIASGVDLKEQSPFEVPISSVFDQIKALKVNLLEAKKNLEIAIIQRKRLETPSRFPEEVEESFRKMWESTKTEEAKREIEEELGKRILRFIEQKEEAFQETIKQIEKEHKTKRSETLKEEFKLTS